MKNILLIGGSDGIGLALTRRLAADGATLTLVARHAPALQAALAALPGAGYRCLVADLATPEGVGLVAELIDENRYDVFLNNAGEGLYGRFETLPLDRQLPMMRLNMEAVTVRAYHYLTHARAGGSRNTFSAANRQITDEVAHELVQVLHQRSKPRVVSGARNRLILFGQRWLPRAGAVNIMGGLEPAKES